MSCASTIATLLQELEQCDREVGLPKSEAHRRRWQKRRDKIAAEIEKAKAALPPSHLEAIATAGFDILSFQDEAIEVRCASGLVQSEWLPEDLIHWQKRRLVRWRTDDQYAFHGWSPQWEGHFGGRYRTVHEALGWFVCLEREMRSALEDRQ